MTSFRTFRVWFLGSMLASIAAVMVWEGVIGWRAKFQQVKGIKV